MSLRADGGGPHGSPTSTGGRLDSGLSALDDALDAAFARWRGRPGADTAAAVVSNLGDYGFIWALAAAAKGRRRGPARRRAWRALALAGVTSFGVNALAKALVRRQRPPRALRLAGTDTLPVRSPSSSSFPSGHTLAAFCTAVVLAEGPVEAAAYLGLAAAVGASRVHLEAHHGSDVLGGALIGALLGLATRPVLGRWGTPRPGTGGGRE